MVNNIQFDKKDIKRIKRDVYASHLIRNSFKGLVFIFTALIIWGIIMFIFQDYDYTVYKLFKGDSVNYTLIILMPLILNAFICIVSLVVKLINSFCLSKTLNKYNLAVNDLKTNEIIQEAETMRSINLAANMTENEALSTLSDVAMIEKGSKVVNVWTKSAEDLAEKANIKVNKFICSLSFYLTIISMLLLIGIELEHGLYTKKQVNNLIVETEEKIAKAYQGINIELEHEFFSTTKTISYKIKYDNINMTLQQDFRERFKITKIHYITYTYSDDEEKMEKLSATYILENLQMLQNNLVSLEDIIKNKNLINYQINFSDTLKNKIDMQRTKDDWSEYNVKHDKVVVSESFEASDYDDDGQIEAYSVSYIIH